MSGLFRDSKTFADASPKIHWTTVLEDFEKQKSKDGFILKSFITKHFHLPGDSHEQLQTQCETLEEQIETLWNFLHREPDKKSCSSLIPLNYPYTVPGGRFREIYYWDCYFTALGLIASSRVKDVKDLVKNFIDLQNQMGLIPNGNRWYYYTRSQPPVLALMVELLKNHEGLDQDEYVQYMSAVEKEYAFWMNGSENLNKGQAYRRAVKLPCGGILNRYYDDAATPRPESYLEDIELSESLSVQGNQEFFRHIRAACESGWDFSSRWLKNTNDLASIATTELLPVDLNCLLYFMEDQLNQFHRYHGNQNKSNVFATAAANRKKNIESYFWSSQTNWYVDFWHTNSTQSRTISLAGLWPLFFKICEPKQAGNIAINLERQLLKSGGLLTTLNHSSQQWDAPNGWAPLHWVAVKGLENYGYYKLARTIAQRWLSTVEQVFQSTGRLMEKYNVTDSFETAQGGEYEVQEGFGWTNGVSIALGRWLQKDFS